MLHCVKNRVFILFLLILEVNDLNIEWIRQSCETFFKAPVYIPIPVDDFLLPLKC